MTPAFIILTLYKVFVYIVGLLSGIAFAIWLRSRLWISNIRNVGVFAPSTFHHSLWHTHPLPVLRTCGKSSTASRVRFSPQSWTGANRRRDSRWLGGDQTFPL